MDVEYKGQHAIIFFKDVKTGYIKRNSWIDFHMIPATRPYVALGTPNYAAIPIPGTSKRMDVTDYRPGGLTFGPRTGTWEFYIDHNKWSKWDNAYNTIKYYIHGNNFLINLTDDPYVLYQGVLTISGYVAGQNYSKITIQYDLMSETMLLDEPIDFGDFGRLPDPKFVDTDGDGQPDAIDTGSGEDVELIHNKELETCDGVKLYLPSNQSDWPSKFVRDDYGYILGIDIDGDGTMDYKCITDSRGVYGLDYNCDGEVDEGQSFAPPSDSPVPQPEIDPMDHLPDEDLTKDVNGVDFDCDGIIDFEITNTTKPPVLVYDENTGDLLGIDFTHDGKIDIYAEEDDHGRQGIDLDCDGEWDIGPYTPSGRNDDEGVPEPGQEDPHGSGGETPVVIGAYYPLLFITNEGESSMYGFASVSKSRNTLGIYDLYTIYESDKVTPGSMEVSSDDEIIIG